jgi:hypothetical protein
MTDQIARRPAAEEWKALRDELLSAVEVLFDAIDVCTKALDRTELSPSTDPKE